MIYKRILLILVVLAISAGTGYAAGEKSYLEAIPRISKEELKANLDNKSYVIIDVRTPKDYGNSDHKIVGARRENPMDVRYWPNYPKDKTLVLYCA